MITIKNPLSLSTFVFAAALLLHSCAPPKPGMYQNETIPSGIKSTVHDLNDQLLKALKDNADYELKPLFSQEYIDRRVEWIKTAEGISIDMKKGDFSLLADYYLYTTPQTTTDTMVIHERSKGDGNFDLTVRRAAKQTYVALFVQKDSPEQWVIAVTYNKLDYGWKVSNIETSPYAENGKTSPELVAQSKELLKKGYWLDAINAASYAVNTLRPLEQWRYLNEDKMYKYCLNGLDSVKSVHPLLSIKLLSPAAEPKVWRMTLQRTADGAFPNVNYISNISLLDTTAIKKENLKVQQDISKAFPGIDKDKKYIYYTIYNEKKFKSGNTTLEKVPFRDHTDIKQKL